MTPATISADSGVELSSSLDQVSAGTTSQTELPAAAHDWLVFSSCAPAYIHDIGVDFRLA